MINIRGLLTAGLESFGRMSSERWNTLVRAVRELQDMNKTGSGGESGVTLENFKSLMKRYGEDLFLSKQHPDKTSFLIQFLAGIMVGEYVEGLKGAIITKEGDAELESLVTRGLARLAELFVEGDSAFRGSLSSETFTSGFPSGTGWAIQKKEYTNAAGEIEYKYILECDGANIRNTLRVYEFIVSQLLGENDNRIFTAMAEVHHYDPETGKVWLNTNCGKLYMPFRQDDCIMVQQYQPGNDVVSGGDGYITKNYELLITEVGSGGMTDENGDRLDWVKFTNFSTMIEGGTPETLIKKLDTFCRVDNLTDPERKGIIELMTVGTNMPYIDILYGMKTDPDGALKGRIGNLQGIHHHLFGWLQEFGEYLINAYIVGEVRLRRTGESLDTTVEILKGLVATKVAETVFEVTDDANYLRNAEFTELNSDGTFRDWTLGNDEISFYGVGGEAVVSSVGTLADTGRCVKSAMIDGSQVLHIVNSSISQSHDVMTQPGTHKEYNEGTGQDPIYTYNTVRDKLYMSVRIRVVKQGTLTIGFPSSQMTDGNAIKKKTRLLERNSEWVTLQWEGTWDGQSDFFLGFTGECYITSLSLSDEPLDEFKTEYSTHIRQTSRNISLEATKISKNSTDISNLQIYADGIDATVQSVSDTVDGHTESIGSLNIRAGGIDARVQTIEGDYVKSAEISMMVKKDANGYLESGVYVYADRINFTFTKTTSFYSKNGNDVTEVMNINPAGDLWIKGDLLGGNIKGNYTLGTAYYRVELYADERIFGPSYPVLHSGIRGVNGGSTYFDLTVAGVGTGQSVAPRLMMTDANSSPKNSTLGIQKLRFKDNANGVTVDFGIEAGKIVLYGTQSAWYNYSQINDGTHIPGEVYVDDNGFMKVKNWVG